MFIVLLVITFILALAVSALVTKIFTKSIDAILIRIISDEISSAWLKYIKFAIYVVGVSSGVRINEVEKYITAPQIKDSRIVELTGERWILEIYRTIIETLQGIAWMLLVFFVFALIAYVIVSIFESKSKSKEEVK